MSLTVRVVAPDRTVWDDSAEEIILPSTTGQLGILSGHAPLLTALDTGVMSVRTGQGWMPIALMGGFAEVETDEVIVLVNGAERGDAIDRSEAQADYARAKERVERASDDDPQEKIKAKQALKRARARLQAAGGTAS